MQSSYCRALILLTCTLAKGAYAQPPTFTSPSYSVQVQETTTITVVGVAPSPRPPDGFLTVRCINGSNSSVGIYYTVRQVNGSFPFVLNSTTGNFSVTQDLVYAMQSHSYNFSVWCYDNLSPNLSSNASVTISVIEVDKYKPVITPSYLFLTLNETTPVGTVLASTRRDVGALSVYNATDMDVGPQGALHYNLYYSDPRFSADGTFGTLTVQQSLSVDYIGATTFINIIITACDPHVCSSDFNVYITILRQNDYYPMFSQKVYSVTYNDSTPPGQMIPSICTDQDIGVGALQDVVFLNTTPGVFSLNQSTGALTTSIRMDYRRARGYTVVLLCRDTVGLTNTSTVYVTITPPANYSPLKFSDLFFIFNVSRATLPLTNVGQLTAKDEIMWATTLTYVIDKNPYFIITDGRIQTNTSVYDYMCDVMVLNVSVTDGIYTDLTVVYIVLIANTTAEPSSQATPTVIPTAPNGTTFHTASSADRTVVPTSSSADRTVVPTSSSADRTVVPTSSSADRMVVPTSSSADRTVVPTSSSADRTVVPTPSSSSKAAITPPTIPASCFITNQATPPPSSVSPSTSIVLPIILTLVCGLALVVAILLFVCLICCHCWRISHKDKTQESPDHQPLGRLSSVAFVNRNHDYGDNLMDVIKPSQGNVMALPVPNHEQYTGEMFETPAFYPTSFGGDKANSSIFHTMSAQHAATSVHTSSESNEDDDIDGGVNVGRSPMVGPVLKALLQKWDNTEKELLGKDKDNASMTHL